MLIDNFKPKAYEDIAVYPAHSEGEDWIGSTTANCFIGVKPEATHITLTLLQLMDGSRCVLELKELASKIDMDAIVIKFIRAGLIENSSSLEYETCKNQNPTSTGYSLFTIKAFDRLNILHVARYLPEVALVINALLLPIVICLAIELDFEVSSLFFPRVLPSRLIIYCLSCGVFLVVHEFFHLCAMRRHNLNGLELTFSLRFYISPTFLARGKGMYMLAKKSRIMIWLSGVIAHLFLLLAFLLAHLLTHSPLFLMLSFINFQLILINLIPIASSDGYFVLSSLLNKVNLHRKYTTAIAYFPRRNIINRFSKREILYVLLATVYVILFLFYQSVHILSMLRINMLVPLIITPLVLYLGHVMLIKLINKLHEKSRVRRVGE